MKSFPLSRLISLLALAAGLLTACSPNLNQTAKEWNGADARTLATVCAALEWDIRDGEVSRLISEDVLATREYNSDSEWGLGRPQTYGDMAEFVDTYYSNIQIRESVYNSSGEVAPAKWPCWCPTGARMLVSTKEIRYTNTNQHPAPSHLG